MNDELFPFQSHFLDVRGARVHYIDEGDGPVFLALHGNPTWSFRYRHIVRGLCDRFRCIALDYPGFGLSTAPASYRYTIAEHARIVDDVVGALELRDITLMVQDWGGPIGFWVATFQVHRRGAFVADVKHFDQTAVLGTVVQLFWRRGLATTGIQDLVTATGVNRSSLYATFGDKHELYLAALDRYLAEDALPGFARLAGDPRGLPAITQFFTQLIRARCSGERARWGCLMVNAHTGPESADPGVRRRLDHHHTRLRAALRDALGTAHRLNQLQSTVDIDAAAGQLALLAYGINLRSRAGTPAAELNRTVQYTLTTLGKR